MLIIIFLYLQFETFYITSLFLQVKLAVLINVFKNVCRAYRPTGQRSYM